MPRNAMASVATTSMTTRSSKLEFSPSMWSPTYVASATKAPTVSTSPWENLMTSSTPKKSVNPTATSAYIMPSISPFMTYWAISPAVIADSDPYAPFVMAGPAEGRVPAISLRRARYFDKRDARDKPAHDDGGCWGAESLHVYFCPGSLRLPDAYSLSSHSTNLPS